MRTLVGAVLLIAVGAIVGVIGWEYLRHGSGPAVSVLLRDGGGLETGDEVVFGSREVGSVDEIESEGNRVRVTIRLDADAAAALTRDTTFKVEADDHGTHRLEAHVLDAEAPPLRDGDTVEGVGSSLELTLRKAAKKAAGLIDRAADSEWLKETSHRVEAVIAEFERTDWDAVGKDVERQWNDIAIHLRTLGDRAKDEGRSAYERLEPELNRIIDQLEAAGKSKEAEELRQRLDALWRDVRPPVPPELPEPPATLPPEKAE